MYENDPDGYEFKPVLDEIGDRVSRKIAFKRAAKIGGLSGYLAMNMMFGALRLFGANHISLNEARNVADAYGLYLGAIVLGITYGAERLTYKALGHFSLFDEYKKPAEPDWGNNDTSE